VSSNECPECGAPKHPLLCCPECGFTHRLAAPNTRSDTTDPSPAVAWQPPTITDQTAASSGPVIRHKRRRLTAVAGSSVPRCAVCDSPAVPGEALCAQHGADSGLFD
jgi:hypothetical protein